VKTLIMDEFSQFSSDVGRRIELVQGAGGNTSVKIGPVLKIKASGAWLADALEKPIFVDVDLGSLRAAMRGDFTDETLKSALQPANGGALRPSIETPLHALSPYQIVAHVHSVNTIAFAARADARERLAERLDGLDWAFVPYERPGAPLAKAVREIFRSSAPKILVFGNHGLVVAGDSIGDLRRLLDDVEQRLSVPFVSGARSKAREQPHAPEGYRWVEDRAASFLPFDKLRLALAMRGSLYPDHVVFLGPALAIAADTGALLGMKPAPKIAAVPGVGLLARKDLTPGALAMLDCLGLVLARIDPAAPINYLTPEDERALLGWDAETYRQSLDQRGASASAT
jgi:rhamnose utilization protein RhaD (predicted bifunctional aldolase and dehydrogenase)